MRRISPALLALLALLALAVSSACAADLGLSATGAGHPLTHVTLGGDGTPTYVGFSYSPSEACAGFLQSTGSGYEAWLGRISAATGRFVSASGRDTNLGPSLADGLGQIAFGRDSTSEYAVYLDDQGYIQIKRFDANCAVTATIDLTTSDPDDAATRLNRAYPGAIQNAVGVNTYIYWQDREAASDYEYTLNARLGWSTKATISSESVPGGVHTPAMELFLPRPVPSSNFVTMGQYAAACPSDCTVRILRANLGALPGTRYAPNGTSQVDGRPFTEIALLGGNEALCAGANNSPNIGIYAFTTSYALQKNIVLASETKLGRPSFASDCNTFLWGTGQYAVYSVLDSDFTTGCQSPDCYAGELWLAQLGTGTVTPCRIGASVGLAEYGAQVWVSSDKSRAMIAYETAAPRGPGQALGSYLVWLDLGTQSALKGACAAHNAFASGSAAHISLVPVHLVAPGDTNAGITGPLLGSGSYMHLALAPVGAPRNALVVFFAGTGGPPEGYQYFAYVCAQQGFHCINLAYLNDDSVNSVTCAGQPDDCEGDVRKEALTGTFSNPYYTVTPLNSIDGRLVALLEYLAANDPSEGWAQYLVSTGADPSVDPEADLVWSKIIPAGHSQGGGMAAMAGVLNAVPRVLMFSSTEDAPWTSETKATDGDLYWWFADTGEDSITDFEISAHNLGIPGSLENVDSVPAPYEASHRLLTSRTMRPPGRDNNPEHSVVVTDNGTPLSADGSPLFAPEWIYMLESSALPTPQHGAMRTQVIASLPATLNADFDPANNTVEGLGAGGRGAAPTGTTATGGGQGGQYCKAVNVALAAGETLVPSNANVPVPGAGNAAAGAYIKVSGTKIFEAHNGANSAGTAGANAAFPACGVSAVAEHEGGAGGNASAAGTLPGAGGGGGGAGGPSGDGTSGGNGSSSAAVSAGGGGGGAPDGQSATAGVAGNGLDGGAGGTGPGGAPGGRGATDGAHCESGTDASGPGGGGRNGQGRTDGCTGAPEALWGDLGPGPGGSGSAGYETALSPGKAGDGAGFGAASGGVGVGRSGIAGSAAMPGAGVLVITYQSTDGSAPTTPTGLTATPTPSFVELRWTAAADAGTSGLAGYRIYRDGALIAATNATHYEDGSGAPGTLYSYTVSAYDNAANESAVSTAASATSGAGEGAAPVLTADVSHDNHAISPLIYGWLWGPRFPTSSLSSLATATKPALVRWGGDAASKYNWQIDGTNGGEDSGYFYGFGDATPSGLPDAMIDTISAPSVDPTAKYLVTVPMLPFVQGTIAESCSFPQSLYSTQDNFDAGSSTGYVCGNGAHNGVPIEDTDKLFNYVANSTALQGGWLDHLIAKFGTGQYYECDNEPSGWSNTHRDIYLPAQQPLYDTIVAMCEQYASLIKSKDPAAKVIGPSDFTMWGWIQDAPSGATLNAAQYYLQQFASHDAGAGARDLDDFDEHYGIGCIKALYPTCTVQQGFDQVRTWWDPTYTTGSSFEAALGGPIEFIPRFQSWIDKYYPGTKLSVSEYELWTTGDATADVLIEADALGVFGKYGLDIANLCCSYASPYQALAPAFELYRNYDGAGATFGDEAFDCASADQSELSLYCAVRTSDGALTVLVINKTPDDLNAGLAFASTSMPASAAVYSYSAASPATIVHEADAAITAGTISYDFPARSATLFVAVP